MPSSEVDKVSDIAVSGKEINAALQPCTIQFTFRKNEYKE